MIMNKSISYLALTALMLLSVSVSAQGLYAPPSDELHPAPPSVPAYGVFCGDTLWFDTPEKYERMDRELMSFTYMHTTTTLMLKRSGRYFPMIEKALKAAGIPDDFKYLCVIESNLDPKAVSVSGAAGLWQFTKTTARDYGMMVNLEVDERFNDLKETEAACQYIKRAYAKFKNWYNVAASYNCGMGGVSARIADQQQEAFEDLWLPEETTRYIYRILAAKMLFSNPKAFGYDIKEKYSYVEPLHTVTVSGSIENLVEFANQYSISYADLKRANLWLRDNKLLNKEQRTYIVVIPRTKLHTR